MRALIRFFLFGVVGAIGFFVDVSVLYISKGTLGLYFGRMISFATSVIITWLLNRKFTFAERSSTMAKHEELPIYFVLVSAGGCINYAVYMLLIAKFPIFQLQPLWAVAAGSIAGMFVNMFGVSKFLFKFKK